LNVRVSGAGQGSVTSLPAGIDCGADGSDCTQPYDQNTKVTLTATPGVVSRFGAWSGGCSSSAISCTLTMDMAKQVTATFDLIPTYTLTVSLDGAGSGAVESDPAGIACRDNSADCSKAYLEGTVVSLTAAADTGSHFVVWSGDCSGTAPACKVTIDAVKTATATFDLDRSRVYLPMVLKGWP
jgi:hypothetical protein